MAEHDYFLQYHLYVVAADRWLRRRVKGYDYEKRFGGVFYLFARGMSPAHAAGTGVFFDRPRAALVGALSEVLDG
jgi:exodeoxyribonuclease V beta subunit